MIAPEGTGVFFAHFMGSHAPLTGCRSIYGERLVATAIAAEGDRVAVAYEEPNGTRQQVDVALSQTQGHIFEWHVDGVARRRRRDEARPSRSRATTRRRVDDAPAGGQRPRPASSARAHSMTAQRDGTA